MNRNNVIVVDVVLYLYLSITDDMAVRSCKVSYLAKFFRFRFYKAASGRSQPDHFHCSAIYLLVVQKYRLSVRDLALVYSVTLKNKQVCTY